MHIEFDCSLVDRLNQARRWIVPKARIWILLPQIPSDPYDVPVKLAKQLFEYQNTIQLTAD